MDEEVIAVARAIAAMPLATYDAGMAEALETYDRKGKE